MPAVMTQGARPPRADEPAPRRASWPPAGTGDLASCGSAAGSPAARSTRRRRTIRRLHRQRAGTEECRSARRAPRRSGSPTRPRRSTDDARIADAPVLDATHHRRPRPRPARPDAVRQSTRRAMRVPITRGFLNLRLPRRARQRAADADRQATRRSSSSSPQDWTVKAGHRIALVRRELQRRAGRCRTSRAWRRRRLGALAARAARSALPDDRRALAARMADEEAEFEILSEGGHARGARPGDPGDARGARRRPLRAARDPGRPLCSRPRRRPPRPRRSCRPLRGRRLRGDRRGGPWALRATRDLRVDRDNVTGFRHHFEELAARHGGEFDGWEAAAD